MRLTNPRWTSLAPASVALVLAGSTNVIAAEQDEAKKGPWEITVGAGAAYLPVYPGSHEYETRGLPVVSVRYKRFFLGGAPGSGSPAGIGAHLYEGESLRLGAVVSVDATKPREESDDVSLRGLGDIDAAVRAGLFSSYRVASWLTLRASAMTDVSDKQQGTLANIDVEFSYRPTARLTLSGGPGLTWSNQEYMQTFFGITDQQAARSGLASYTHEAGVSVVRLSVGAQYQFSAPWFAGARITAAQLQDDATASPIVQEKNQNLYALYFGYRF
jgi:MipA family protein